MAFAIHKESTRENLSRWIKDRAKALGFDLVGIAEAIPSVFQEEYRDWIARGYAGEMAYLARHLERRLNPQTLLPNARSIIAVGMSYYADEEEGPGPPSPDAERAIFARYARGDDYHHVLSQRLYQLLADIQQHLAPHAEGRVYVDTGPILEREVAQRAGLGWIGKNTMLIHPQLGSYLFLGVLITNLDLEPDTPMQGHCGRCTRCLEACPTGALVAPHLMDATLCISYLTIELKGHIPEPLRPALSANGNRIFGCDICQEVCPFCLKFSRPTSEPAFQPREITSHARLTDLLLLSEEQFREKFRKSPVKRAKRRGLLRNVATALATSNDPAAQAALKHAAHNDPDPLVREHAAWALRKSTKSSKTS